MQTFNKPINFRLFSRFTTLSAVVISLFLLTTTSLAQETPQIEQIEYLETEVVTQPNNQKIKIKFKKEQDTKPPEINIRFKEGYKKGSLSERPNKAYKRSIFIEISSDLSEQEQNAKIIKKCENYNDQAKPNYFVNLLDQETKKPIRSLSCEKAKHLISEK